MYLKHSMNMNTYKVYTIQEKTVHFNGKYKRYERNIINTVLLSVGVALDSGDGYRSKMS